MRCWRLIPALGLAFSLMHSPGFSPAYAQDYPIHVIEPMSGNAAFVGAAHATALRSLQEMINQDGGIAGRKLKLVFHDDQTSPQQAVQITNEILAEQPAVMLGSSIVAMCGAELPLLRNGPFDYCLSPGMHPPVGSYMYSIGVNTHALIQVAFRYFRKRGLTRIASITSTDATGQEIEQGFDDALKNPDNAGVSLVARTRFSTSDVSVTAQIERIKAADPQVLIVWSTGTAIASIFKGLVQAGIDLPVLTSNGNMANSVMAQFAGFLPKTLYVPSTEFTPHDGLYTLDPAVEEKQRDFYAIAKRENLGVDYMTAGVWDTLLMMVDALRALGPDAKAPQVRDWIASQTHLAGINGLYDFKAEPQRGLNESSGIINQWDAEHGAWHPVCKPGGEPL
jgi:branched-chain amino acid transport system substrate-binding protein